jgi:amino acid transporter
MWSGFRRWLVGPPLATHEAGEQRLSKTVALATFSSDALSSVAYATEAILVVLALAGGAAMADVVPISMAIVVLLWLVGFSYRQTVFAYPSGGGAYIVAKDNLGTHAGLTAAAALLVDYVLTVAVSATAGIAAITSAAQGTSFAWLAGHKAALCAAAIVVLTVANLRGLRESGTLFSVPTYLFVGSSLVMIALGLMRYFTGSATPITYGESASAAHEATRPLTLYLLLSAFANGCTAMTGVEAISNGVPAFRRPESRNAAVTLIWMVTLLTAMFLGTSWLAHLYHVQPSDDETVLSQIGRQVFTGGASWMYYVVQAATAAILLLAANTSFADFPRLASLMARDGFLPHQFAARGDRLVFSNGIILLAGFSCVLVIVFGGDTSRLIPLYAVGVFLSFTLSQAGMVRHWWRLGHAPASDAEESAAARGWMSSLVVNGAGAVATAVVLSIFLVTKFIHGAWIVAVVVPLLVALFRSIGDYYARIAKELQPRPAYRLVCHVNTIILPVTRVHSGIIKALEYALCTCKDVQAVYVEIEEEDTPHVQEAWDRLAVGIPLQILPSPYRTFVGVMLPYIDDAVAKRGEGTVTVLLPEFVPPHWWEEVLHNYENLRLKAALLYRPGVVVTSVPFHIG